MSHFKASLLSGVLSGAAGLLVFLGLHHLWIKPIWDMLPPGLLIAGLGGLAAGWAYGELFPRMPRKPWSILTWVFLVSLTLAPAVLLAQLRPPAFSGSSMNAAMTITVTQALIRLARDLLLTAALTGGLLGWLLGRTKRAALAMALAGLVFALGPGHNIPFLGNTPVVGKGLLLLLAIIVSASTVLVEAHAVLTRGVGVRRKEEISHV